MHCTAAAGLFDNVLLPEVFAGRSMNLHARGDEDADTNATIKMPRLETRHGIRWHAGYRLLAWRRIVFLAGRGK